MTIASGVAKQVRIKKETAWGTAPGVVTGAQLLRRTSSNLDVRKAVYQSNEIRTDYQVADMRHGTRTVEGTLNGELSPGTYQMLIAAALRKGFAASTGTVSQTTISAQAAAPQFSRSGGSWLTDGHKVGDVVRFTGFSAPATGNNTKNFLITELTGSDMTGVFLNGDAVTAKTAGDSVSVAMAGKKTFAPTTGHTDDSFAIEHWYSDIAQSELFLGCKVNTVDVALPPTGMATVAFNFIGKDVQTDTSAFYSAPTAETGTGVISAVNGAVYVDGVAVALLTGLNFTISGNMTYEPVVGSNSIPDLFEGRVLVSGQFTAFFQDAAFRDLFLDETEASVIAAFSTGNLATSDVIVFTFPRIKAGGAGKDDGEKGIVQTIPFTALLDTAGGASADSEATTISIQDTQAT